MHQYECLVFVGSSVGASLEGELDLLNLDLHQHLAASVLDNLACYNYGRMLWHPRLSPLTQIYRAPHDAWHVTLVISFVEIEKGGTEALISSWRPRRQSSLREEILRVSSRVHTFMCQAWHEQSSSYS